jgi:hypothetical protein
MFLSAWAWSAFRWENFGFAVKKYFFDEKKAKSLAVRPRFTRFTCASTFCALLASSFSFFSRCPGH